MIDDSLFYDMFEQHLTNELLKQCTAAGLLKGQLLQSEDIDAKWKEYAPEYMADSIKEIAQYPTVSVGWAVYIGMAVACWWSRDWEGLKDQPYKVLYGTEGFDNMDDHIVSDILGLPLQSKEAQKVVELVRQISETAVTFIRQERVEPQSRKAFYLFAHTTKVMFRIGAAIELFRLGYEWQRLDIAEA